MKTAFPFFLLCLIYNVAFSQGLIPYHWDIYPCSKDIQHRFFINHQPIKLWDSKETVKIGDTLLYEIEVVAEGGNLYDISVKYDVFVQAELNSPRKIHTDSTAFAPKVVIPIIMTAKNMRKYLGTSKSGKLAFEVLDFYFQDKQGIIRKIDSHSAYFCCKTSYFNLEKRKNK